MLPNTAGKTKSFDVWCQLSRSVLTVRDLLFSGIYIYPFIPMTTITLWGAHSSGRGYSSEEYHHHHISFMKLGHLLTRSGLTYPEVLSKVNHDSFCQLGSSISLPWVIYFEVFYLHVVSSFSCIAVICPKLVSFLTPLQFVRLFCNLSKYILSKIFGRIFDPKVTGLPSNLYWLTYVHV